MTPRFPFSLLLPALLLCSVPTFAALTTGPERSLAPSTTAVRVDGETAALAASDTGFLSVWHSWQAKASFFRRLDRSGQPVDAVGVRLPVELFDVAAAWTGTDYVIAGPNFSDGIVAMALGGEPRVLADVEYPSEPRLTFNGSVLLVTWRTQSNLTQTLHGVLLEPDLEPVGVPFVVATRDVAGLTMPLDHWSSPSVAANGEGFLVSWEMVPTLIVVSGSGEVTPGAPLSAEALQPTVVADNGGMILLWHDRDAIHARRVASDGSALTLPVTLVRAAGLAEIAGASAGTELVVAWRTAGTLVCEAAPIFAMAFDGSFHAGGEVRTLSDTPAHGIALAGGDTAVASWIGVTCGGGSPVVRMATMTGQARTISRFIAPSAQTDPDAATDGTGVLAIWSEQRDDELPGVYGAMLDAEGSVLRSIDIARGREGRVAFGDGRYLVAWQYGTTIAARFLDDEPFTVVAAASSPFALAWNGERFVVVWNEGTTLRSVFVSPSGFVTAGPSLENAGAAAGMSAGPRGEVAVFYRVETPQQVEVRVATLRTEWHVEDVLATAPRPCQGKQCPDYDLLAIGWSGRDYLVVWKKSAGIPYQGVIESRLLHGGTTRIGVAYSNYQLGSGAELAWTGSSFLLALQIPAIQAYWPLSYVAQVNDAGALLEGLNLVSTTEAASPPAIALPGPGRAVVVYDRQVGLTQRVFARSLRIVDPPRRRAARH